MSGERIRTSRRALLGTTVAGVAGVAPAGAMQSQATPEPATPQPATDPGRVEAPAWVLVVHRVQDPYPGAMRVPDEIPSGARAVAAEIEVIDDADQALGFTSIDVRLRDADGVDYRGGGAIGEEPTINPRNLNPGERARGWVWFILPEGAEAVELVYIAPQPQFRLPLPLSTSG